MAGRLLVNPRRRRWTLICSAASRASDGTTCEYRSSVMPTVAWPRRSETTSGWTPALDPRAMHEGPISTPLCTFVHPLAASTADPRHLGITDYQLSECPGRGSNPHSPFVEGVQVLRPNIVLVSCRPFGLLTSVLAVPLVYPSASYQRVVGECGVGTAGTITSSAAPPSTRAGGDDGRQPGCRPRRRR